MASLSIESRRRPADHSIIIRDSNTDSQQQNERCPRCDSTDTKFCYYNNYNTSQPRHFCKSCRRYWTLGGSLRNVPIGGSTRKRLRTNPISRTGTCTGTGLVPSHLFGPNGLVGFGGPFFHGRVGFEVGLGSRSGLGLDSLDDIGLGFGPGNGPVMWPMLSMINEANVDTWKMEIGRMDDQTVVPVPAQSGLEANFM